MARSLKIGEVARATGVAASTIRYYEQVGVLPAAARSSCGYRRYDESALERLRFIRRGRSLRLPLRQLAVLMTAVVGGPRPMLRPRLLALVHEKISSVQDQIAELEGLRQELQQVSDRIRSSRLQPRTGPCQCLETEGATGHQRNGPLRAL